MGIRRLSRLWQEMRESCLEGAQSGCCPGGDNLFMAWHISVDGSSITFRGVLIAPHYPSSAFPCPPGDVPPWTSAGAMAVVWPPSPEALPESAPLSPHAPPNAVQPQPVAREGGDCRSWAGTWLSPSFWEENCLLFCSQTLASFKNTLGSLNIISPK